MSRHIRYRLGLGIAGALSAAALGGMVWHATWQGAFSRRRHTSVSLGQQDACAELLDRHLPVFDVAEVWQADVAASPAVTYDALLRLDIMRSPVIATLVRLYMGKMRLLQALRGGEPPPVVPASAGLEDLLHAGWTALEDVPAKGLVLGMPVRVGAVDQAPAHLDPAAFRGFARPGFWKIVWGFAIEPRGAGSRLTTSTRTAATDTLSRRRFWAHWLLIGPSAGLLKRRLLALVKADAESCRLSNDRVSSEPQPVKSATPVG